MRIQRVVKGNANEIDRRLVYHFAVGMNIGPYMQIHVDNNVCAPSWCS